MSNELDHYAANSHELTEQELVDRRESLRKMAQTAGLAGLATASILTSRRALAASGEA